MYARLSSSSSMSMEACDENLENTKQERRRREAVAGVGRLHEQQENNRKSSSSGGYTNSRLKGWR